MLEYRELSLTARFAVALHCFSRYCEKHDLRHSEIDAFLDNLWEFPVVDLHRLDDWFKHHPTLIYTALGDPWPQLFMEYLDNKKVNQADFRQLLSDVTEIVYSSFYCESEEELSWAQLSRVFDFVASAGVALPPSQPFANSRFTDRDGWGKKLTVAERDAWRALTE